MDHHGQIATGEVDIGSATPTAGSTLGASFAHSSISMSPAVVFSTTCMCSWRDVTHPKQICEGTTSLDAVGRIGGMSCCRAYRVGDAHLAGRRRLEVVDARHGCLAQA